MQGPSRSAARPDRRPQRVRLDAVPARALSGRADHQLFRVLLSSAPVGHGLPPRVPAVRARLPPGAVAERDAAARPGELPPRLQPDALSAQLFPEVYRPKIDVIFDGIETDIFRRQRRRPPPDRRPVDPRIDPDRHLRQPRLRGDARVRHLHEGRQARSTSSFPTWFSSVVGSDRVCYGGDEKHIRAQDVPRARDGPGRLRPEQVHLHGAAAASRSWWKC